MPITHIYHYFERSCLQCGTPTQCCCFVNETWVVRGVGQDGMQCMRNERTEVNELVFASEKQQGYQYVERMLERCDEIEGVEVLQSRHRDGAGLGQQEMESRDRHSVAKRRLQIVLRWRVRSLTLLHSTCNMS